MKNEIRKNEIFSGLVTVSPFFVRIDGRSFHGLLQSLQMKKPFDERFRDAMADACKSLLDDSGLNPLFAYTFSDEINLYFRLPPFGGRVEKIDSVAASFASSVLTSNLKPGMPLAMDARIIPSPGSFVIDYLIDRQAEAWRNLMNSYCQHALIGEGKTPRQSAELLLGMKSSEMHEMMFERGVNLAKTPAWQRRGIMVFRGEYEKTGYNPVEEKEVRVTRRRAETEMELPLFSTEEGRKYLSLLAFGPDADCDGNPFDLPV
jgi:tRNA(His) guanylyltransferase